MSQTISAGSGTVSPLSHVMVDELDSIAAVLSSKFPNYSRAQVRDVVYATYRRLVATASIQAHLIPLTLNGARTRLAMLLTDPALPAP